MAVYSYARVSTGNQGMSLKVQENTLRAYATTMQMEVDQHFADEGVSGSVKLAERPAGGQLINLLKEGDHLLIAKFDRLFRNSEDALYSINRFKEQGIRLYIMDMGGEVTGDGVGKLIYTILAAVADFERSRIAERIRDVKVAHSEEGRFMGGHVPWGHTVIELQEVKYLQESDWYQQALAELADLHWAKGKSTRKIAMYLSEKYAPISHNTVNKLSLWLYQLIDD